MCSYIVYDKYLMTCPREIVSFVSLRPSMFPEAKPRGTLSGADRGNRTYCLLVGPVFKVTAHLQIDNVLQIWIFESKYWSRCDL